MYTAQEQQQEQQQQQKQPPQASQGQKRNVYEDLSHMHATAAINPLQQYYAGNAFGTNMSTTNADTSDNSTLASTDSGGTMMCDNGCSAGTIKRGRHTRSSDAASADRFQKACAPSCFPGLASPDSVFSRRTPHPGDDSASAREKKSLTDGEVLQAMDLRSLSIEERTKAYEDVHAISTVSAQQITRTPQQIQLALQQLSDKLKSMRYKSAYDTALFLYPRVTQNQDLRLMYLRAVDWDIDQAARRIVNFYQHKLDLFGVASLARSRVAYDHEMSDERTEQVLKHGAFQLFPNQIRDRGHRPVYFQMLHLLPDPSNVRCMLRCFFYVLMAGLQEMSPVDQVRGMACVLLLLQGPDGNVLPSWFWDYHVKAVSIAKSLPVKIASCHMCCDSPHFKTLVSLMQVSINKEIRVRFRTFYGSYMESMYSLTSFGIVMKTFPLNSLGGLDEDKHEELLRLRRESDSCQDGQDKHVSDGMSTNQQHAPINFPPVVPRDNDVLLGRGKPFQSHKGNVQLTALVHTKYKAAYKKSSVNERVQIVNTIDIHIKQELGGRFLKKTADGLDWVVVSHDEALKKIKNTFRS